MSSCLSVYWGQPYIPCMSVLPPIHPEDIRGPSVHLSDITVSVSTSVCPSVHPLLVSSYITVVLSYQLINNIVGHLQSQVWLY